VPSSTAVVAVRPGEHACCRFSRAEDRERLAFAFVHDGLRRGHKVIYLCDSDDTSDFVARLAAVDDRVEPALASGQLDLRPARDAYLPDGTFRMEDMLEAGRADRLLARQEGYAGLSLTGEMSALCGAPGSETLAEYERRLADGEHDDCIVLCQYDHGRFSPALLSDLARSHAVDASPELGAIGREGRLSAARITSDGTLRLAGELDFERADALAEVLAAHFHGTLLLDLADVTFIDLAGMRALRGRKGRRLRISRASPSVKRLLGLLAWDTDPAIELVGAP
jgi:anti-anti-sigma factor